jgi:C-methyltransferase C-terminal domain/Putative zinc binding domain/Methyltransferase domain
VTDSYTRLEACRLCSSAALEPVLDLGRQSLTGVFPKDVGEEVTSGPLQLVWCSGCTLLQLAHSYSLEEMYGWNYGYRSGLNRSMVTHLQDKARALEKSAGIRPGDVVIDIGSNDGTLLAGYSTSDLVRVGIDPTGPKFAQYYPDDVLLVPEFFSAEVFRAQVPGRSARIVTSIAMFYDLEHPVDFAREVAEILTEDGVWHFEQSYMPSMLRSTSYDTVCHEHLEYYSLDVVRRLLDEAGLKVVDVRFNRVNGGSFAVTARRRDADSSASGLVEWFRAQEQRMQLSTPKPFRDFQRRVFQHRQDLQELIRVLRADGASVMGYGASTKGNVLLQFCGFTPEDLPAIAEVNPDKFGKVTPGTGIPIVSEDEAKAARPDYLLVLPWHFREGIVQREAEFLRSGGRLIFPLPEIEIVET